MSPNPVPPSPEGEFLIRPATVDEVPIVLRMIRGLAEYEKMSHKVTATVEDIRESLFGEKPAAEVLLAFVGSEPVGFAVYFSNFSTFVGRAGMYLEDLYVDPDWRGRGYGRQLLARLAAVAVERGACRLEWSVLDWNEPAIRFYRSLGARSLDEWMIFRLGGDSLERLAASSNSAEG